MTKTSIFTIISRKAKARGAVNLGQGFPDFEAPAFVKEAGVRAIRDNRNQYAPDIGLPELRQAIAHEWQDMWGVPIDADRHITVMAGATESLHVSITSLLSPGESAVVFEPAYDAYGADIQSAGGIISPVPLLAPDWRLDKDALCAAITERTRLILLNNPHNPTGKVWQDDELAFVAELAEAHDLIVIADEVYRHITDPDVRTRPVRTVDGLENRTVTIDSAGKTFAVTGWRIGWAIAPPHLTARLRAKHQFVTFCSPAPFQWAIAEAIVTAGRTGYYDTLKSEYAIRKTHLCETLAKAGRAPLQARGGFFLCAPLKPGETRDEEACEALIESHGVASIPLSVFFTNPEDAPQMLRFCFAKSEATLDAARRALQRP